MSKAFHELIAFDEREYQRLPAKRQPVFVYEWLKTFEESINAAKKVFLLFLSWSLDTTKLINSNFEHV